MVEQKNRRKRPLVLALAAGLTVAGTGVAFAYWTADGTGSGSATTGATVALVITSDPAVGQPLSPAGPSQTVDFTVTNPGSGDEFLEGVSVRVATASGGVWTAGTCSADDYEVTITSAPTAGSLAPGGSVDGTATIQMIETTFNQDDCQNEVVPLYFEANVPV